MITPILYYDILDYTVLYYTRVTRVFHWIGLPAQHLASLVLLGEGRSRAVVD